LYEREELHAVSPAPGQLSQGLKLSAAAQVPAVMRPVNPPKAVMVPSSVEFETPVIAVMTGLAAWAWKEATNNKDKRYRMIL
jgi:hypothetical protein